jgi:hypothetical protein
MATLLTNTGIKGIIGKLNTTSPPKHIAWGTGGSVAPDASDTSLETEAAENRVEGTNTIVTEEVTDDTYQVVATITSESNQTINEAGLLSASTAGDLYVRGNFTGIPLETDDAIQFTIKTRIGQPE